MHCFVFLLSTLGLVDGALLIMTAAASLRKDEGTFGHHASAGTAHTLPP
jgi:hypothetical protein